MKSGKVHDEDGYAEAPYIQEGNLRDQHVAWRQLLKRIGIGSIRLQITIPTYSREEALNGSTTLKSDSHSENPFLFSS
jgi:hypothetical protein